MVRETLLIKQTSAMAGYSQSKHLTDTILNPDATLLLVRALQYFKTIHPGSKFCYMLVVDFFDSDVVAGTIHQFQ